MSPDSEQALLFHIASMQMAAADFEGAKEALQKETSSGGIPSDAAYLSGMKGIKMYSDILVRECQYSDFVFDLTAEAAEKLSQIIRSMPLERPPPERLRNAITDIPDEEQPLGRQRNAATHLPDESAQSGMLIASARCQDAIMAFSLDQLSARISPTFPSDPGYVSARAKYTIYKEALILHCKSLEFLFKFLAEMSRDVAHIISSRRDQQLLKEQTMDAHIILTVDASRKWRDAADEMAAEDVLSEVKCSRDHLDLVTKKAMDFANKQLEELGAICAQR